jgi:hypothetical protein
MNMKKSLLIAVAAIFVALGANAQYVRVAQKAQWLDVPSDVKMENVMTKDFTPYVKTMKATHRVAAEGLAGEYILNADNFDGDFTESSSFQVVAETGTINLDQYDGNPEFNYNVVLKDFTYTGATVYGYYDEETAVIVIPVQTIFVHATYKEIVISGGYRIGETNVGYGKSIYLIVNEDGTMDIDPDVEEEGDQATIGWVSFLPNYEDGGLWNYGFDIALLKPNATMYYRTTSAAMGGTGEGWEKVEKRVALEDYETEWVINNFLGLCPVSVTLEADHKCSIPFGIKMYDYDRDEPYGMYRLVGISIDGQYIVRNYEKTKFNGFWEPGLAEFYKTEWKDAWTDEDGEHDAGYYFVDTDEDYIRYVAVATANDAEGAAYVIGYACNMSVETDEHAASTGINEVNANTRQSNGKTYNVLGQQVSAGAKGLLIRDGKKFVVK